MKLTDDALCSLAMDSKLALLAVSDKYHVRKLRGHRDLLSLSSNLFLLKIVFITLNHGLCVASQLAAGSAMLT